MEKVIEHYKSQQTLESRALQIASDRVKVTSDDSLLSIWKAATGRYACPEDGWGTYVGGSWVVLTWDEWCDILYSEITCRKLSAL